MALDPADIQALYATSSNPTPSAVNQLVNECTVRWDDLKFAASSITVNPIGAVANPTRDETETDFPGTLLFSGTVDNVLAGSFQMPHSWREGSPINPHIHWSKPAGGAGDNVTWELYLRYHTHGGAPSAWSDALAGVMVIDHNGVAEGEAITRFGPVTMTGKKISQNVAWRLYRRGNADSFNGTARLIEFDVHYEIDSRGSQREFTK